MGQIILEKSTPYIMAIAREDSGKITGAYLDYDDELAPVGSIFKGRVVDLFEEHGYAFVEIGLTRKAYLPLPKVPRDVSIKRGQELLVQVERTPYLEKGSLVSGLVEYTGQHIILTQVFKGIRLSSTLDAETHLSLKATLSPFIPSGYGLMVRSSAANKPPADLIGEIQSLVNLMETCRQALFHHSSPLLYKAKTGVESWIEQGPDQDYSILVSPRDAGILSSLNSRVTLAHQSITSLFYHHQLEDVWNQLTTRQVQLKNGSELVIDETEAFVMIDVNSEKYIHTNQKEDYAYTVNINACEEIARQIRLRNLSGAILIDFIDMSKKGQQKQVEMALKEAMAEDRESIRIMGFTQLGILELTRRRRRPSILQIIRDMYPQVRSHSYSLYQLRRELLRLRGHLSHEKITIHAAEDTLVWFKRYKEALESELGWQLRLELDLHLPYGYRLTLH